MKGGVTQHDRVRLRIAGQHGWLDRCELSEERGSSALHYEPANENIRKPRRNSGDSLRKRPLSIGAVDSDR